MEVTTPRKDQQNSAVSTAHRTTVAAGLWDTLVGARGFKAHFKADKPLDSLVQSPRPRREVEGEDEVPEGSEDKNVEVEGKAPGGLADRDVGSTATLLREVILHKGAEEGLVPRL